MLDEYIERPSLQSIGLGSSRAQPDFLRFGRPVAVPLGRRRHASLYIMTASVACWLTMNEAQGNHSL